MSWETLNDALKAATDELPAGATVLSSLKRVVVATAPSLAEEVRAHAAIRALLAHAPSEIAARPDAAEFFIGVLKAPHAAGALAHVLSYVTIYSSPAPCRRCFAASPAMSVWWDAQADRVLTSCGVCAAVIGEPGTARRKLHEAPELLPGKRGHVLAVFPKAEFLVGVS